MGAAPETDAPAVVGRYALYDPIASGGMATVHLGRLVGPVGFSRTVAIKRLHAQYARDPEFVSMFLDEARLAARVQHPNVVQTLDVVSTGGELFLVMDYVKGESLGRLVRLAAERGMRVPERVATAIVTGALQGLHAAHEATDERGVPLGIVHRDISPQNILVGVDGIARVLDFGVAKAEGKVHTTRDGQLKGKLLYMSPEQLEGMAVGRGTDIYAMGVVLFETLTGERMFGGGAEQVAQIAKIVRNDVRLPSEVVPDAREFDEVVRRATGKHPARRYASGREMAIALERCATPASATEVAEWVELVAGKAIQQRARRVAEIESASQIDHRAVRGVLADELARTGTTGMIPVTTVAPEDEPPPSGTSVPPGAAYSAVQSIAAPRRRRVLTAAAVVVPLVAIGFLLGRSTTGSSPAASSTTGATGGSAASTQPMQAAAPGKDTASAAPADPPQPPEAPSSQPAPEQTPAAVDPPRPPSAAARTPARATVPSRPAAAKPAAKKAACAQPYTVDAAGHLRFREECL